MSDETTWPRIAVLGAGAVGSYFGGMLARAGAPVVMIGRAAFVETVTKSGLLLDTVQFRETVYPEASTEIAAAKGAGRIRDGRAMVATRCGHHARGSNVSHQKIRERAARLERPGVLVELQLRHHAIEIDRRRPTNVRRDVSVGGSDPITINRKRQHS